MKENERIQSESTGQLLRYFVTGVTAFVVEYVLYLILYKILKIDYAVSMLIVYSLLFVLTFVATRKWTFRSDGAVRRQLILYLLLFLFNAYAGNYIMMRGLVGLGVPAEFAPFIKTAMITCWNFLIYKYVIYK